MFIRTYLRTMFNKIFCDNVFIDFGRSVVKFCNNYLSKEEDFLKFSGKMSLTDMDVNKKISFQSITGDKIDCNNIKTCYEKSVK